MLKTKLGNFHLPLDIAGKQLAELGGWESFMDAVFRKYLNCQSHAIDVGAHIGYHTVRLSKICSKGQVYAFEPNPILTDIVKENIKENNCDNVRYYPYAVSDISTKGYLTENENTFLVSLAKGVTNREIQIIRLDDITDLPKIDLIKIDVEGFELSVLKGAKLLIERDKPIIVIEIWDWNLPEYLKYLGTIKYCVYHIMTDNYVALPID